MIWLLNEKDTRKWILPKKPVKGFVFISPDGTKSEKDLSYWLEKSISYNKEAPTSKKKKSKK